MAIKNAHKQHAKVPNGSNITKESQGKQKYHIKQYQQAEECKEKDIG